MLRLFRPAVWLMDRLVYSKKIILIGIVSLIAMSILVTNLFIELDQTIKQSEMKLEGIKKIESVVKLIQLAQKHRDYSLTRQGNNLFLSNYRLMTEEIEIRLYTILDTLDTKIVLETGDGVALNYLGNLSGLWQSVKANQSEKNGIYYSHFIEQLHLLLKVMQDYYQLMTDKELSVYYLVDTLINKMPSATESMGKLRTLVMTILVNQELLDEQKHELIGLEFQINKSFEQLAFNVMKVKHYSPQLSSEINQVHFLALLI